MLTSLTLKNAPVEQDDWRLIPRREYKIAIGNPMFRKKIREVSANEDEENSYYTGRIDKKVKKLITFLAVFSP